MSINFLLQNMIYYFKMVQCVLCVVYNVLLRRFLHSIFVVFVVYFVIFVRLTLLIVST